MTKPAMQHWIEEAEARLPEMIALRRAIHAEPEIGLHNPLTTAKAKAAATRLTRASRIRGAPRPCASR